MIRFGWLLAAVMAGGLVLLLLSGDDGTVLGLPDDAFARMLYLGLLLAVVAAAVAGSGMRFGGVLRSLAVWIAIILVLVGGYQYRYELQDVASRLTAGLVPGSPLSAADVEGRAAVMLDKLPNGHFGVRAQVDGAAVFFLVDTGATATVLTVADASRAGIDPAALRYDVQIMTANGIARAARAQAGEIRVGTIARRDMMVLVAEEGRLGENLLGMNFIGSLSGFSVQGGRMTLID